MIQLDHWRQRIPASRLFVGLALVWLFGIFLFIVAGLRLTPWRAQRGLEVLFWATPLLLVGISILLRWRAARWIGGLFFAATLPIAVPLLAFSMMQFLAALPTAEDPFFEPILTHALEDSRLVLYRTDCGALCDFGLQLRQERRVAPGLKIVRRLAVWKKSYSGEIEQIEPQAFLVTIESDGSRSPSTMQELVRLGSSALWR